MQGNVLAGRIVPQVPGVRVPLDQIQGVQHRPVRRVVAAELQHVQQLDQPGPVMVRVRGSQRGLHRALIRRARGLELRDQVPQHRLRRDREHRVSHQPVTGIHGCLREPEQQVLLAGHVSVISRSRQYSSAASRVSVASGGWLRRWLGASTAARARQAVTTFGEISANTRPARRPHAPPPAS